MANSKTYNLDPNVFLPTAQAGVAQSPGARSDAWVAKMIAACNGQAGAGYEAVDTTATALALDVYESRLAVSGTMALTLAAPTYAGQKKKIFCHTAASTPAATLTVSSPDDTTGFVCPATFFFDSVGQTLELEATQGLKWRAIRKVRTGQKTLVVGTTVTTGIADMSHLNLSVTGTVASLTTKGIPNGAAIGELLIVGCSTAATTPHGDIAAALVSTLGAAGTALDDFAATTDTALLMWTGAAWQVLGLDGATLAVT